METCRAWLATVTGSPASLVGQGAGLFHGGDGEPGRYPQRERE